jgi:DNA-directed RNA polymerase omega subunit
VEKIMTTEEFEDISPDEIVARELSESNQGDIDSKYRMIILAAQRSKQIQRGASPRVEMDTRKHKPTRIALKEIAEGQIRFETTEE